MPEPISSYGLLGDTRIAALVSERGSIDWLCVPRFDGEPVFGALVDPINGGRWSIKPLQSRLTSRAYTDRATSIRSTWEGPSGTVEIHEGMLSDASSTFRARCTLVRRVRCVSGSADVEVLYEPRLGLPGREADRVRREEARLVCTWGAVAIGVESERVRLEPGRVCMLKLHAGETANFVMSLAFREPLICLPVTAAGEALTNDDAWWQRWTERFDCQGAHEDNIVRSLITLRLLTYAPSGAPVAAPTTSLPAPIGSDKTWDYRFAWPRDASIGVGAFLAFGSSEEPRTFLEWFINASRITRPRLSVLYNLDGRPVRHEREVSGVAGYAESKPVRVGNAASSQHQLDVYGWVLDAAWLLHSSGKALERTHWRALRSVAGHLASDWMNPDNGIWEQRRAPQHFVHSKLMAWTGLDRALRLAEFYPAGNRAKQWRTQRDRLAQEIATRGIDARRNTYVRVFDGDDLDASLLILPALEFDSDDGRLRATIDAVRAELGAGGPLLYRYAREDGVAEGAFLPCSFWLVQALARTGRLEEAESAFDELCALATPLGLYAEQIDPATKSHMGNFPLAFTHATFLQAAAALNEARETSRGSTRTGRARSSRPPASARRS